MNSGKRNNKEMKLKCGQNEGQQYPNNKGEKEMREGGREREKIVISKLVSEKKVGKPN